MNAFHGSDCEDDNAGSTCASHNVKLLYPESCQDLENLYPLK